MMNRMTAVSMILGIIAAGTAVADYSVGTVDVQRVSGYYDGWGGEYTFYDTSLSLDAYADVASGKGTSLQSFQSFCIETDETLKTGERDLRASLGTAAVEGGAGGPSPDPLSSEVAWLYTQFATGSLANYAYTGTVGGLTRAQTAGALQRLIWSLEEEGGGSGWEVTVAKFQEVTLNDAQLTLIDSWETLYNQAVLAGWSGIGNVRVLNLERWNKTTGSYEFAQSQLYLVPVPGAVLLGSLGLAYSGLKLRRRYD